MRTSKCEDVKAQRHYVRTQLLWKFVNPNSPHIFAYFSE